MNILTAKVLLFFVFVLPLALGIYWIIWQVWLFIIPWIFESGPQMLLHPNYWQFVGMLVLTKLIGRVLFSK